MAGITQRRSPAALFLSFNIINITFRITFLSQAMDIVIRTDQTIAILYQ
ncbi:hypothetical protein XIS1_1340011 [Xenorhabdus innexi]|uniref:Uncharacterized protein n=1 Tax=Xenorhabdus innexi TaxID=290109 RepID=A0A1N6MT92_9GAMM|nr:hypothetical protein Xinn_02736 [Xenorhabdus innexi]SIP72068.1 hypothetical protein XIS1_1340011 [Xenorhabdus innexi]